MNPNCDFAWKSIRLCRPGDPRLARLWDEKGGFEFDPDDELWDKHGLLSALIVVGTKTTDEHCRVMAARFGISAESLIEFRDNPLGRAYWVTATCDIDETIKKGDYILIDPDRAPVVGKHVQVGDRIEIWNGRPEDVSEVAGLAMQVNRRVKGAAVAVYKDESESEARHG